MENKNELMNKKLNSEWLDGQRDLLNKGEDLELLKSGFDNVMLKLCGLSEREY